MSSNILFKQAFIWGAGATIGGALTEGVLDVAWILVKKPLTKIRDKEIQMS